jgi:hypothetical protein
VAQPYTLDHAQRQILKGIVRAQVYRDPRTGGYVLLAATYPSLEEAEAAALQRCIAERKPPISMFTDFERAQEREQRHERQESEYLDRYQLPKQEKQPESYSAERIKAQARKMLWREDE